MPPILFADNFLAGSLLSLLLPVCLLIALAVWYVRFVRQSPDTSPASSTLPPAAVVAAAADHVDEVEPAGPPPGEIR
ncbi:MAG TPA: hypothetical protein VGH67_01335 [Solirubrobacteraceae bacterium]|jgi:hypothetical protein